MDFTQTLGDTSSDKIIITYQRSNTNRPINNLSIQSLAKEPSSVIKKKPLLPLSLKKLIPGSSKLYPFTTRPPYTEHYGKRIAPSVFSVVFNTNKGMFTVRCYRNWSPYGVDRFYTLVRDKYYNNNTIFRVVEGSIVQFGINGDPRVSQYWEHKTIPDETNTISNTRGRVTFAADFNEETSRATGRTTQIFISTGDNSNLDELGFPPIGEVIFGMDIIDTFCAGYGETAGMDQENMYNYGNKYICKVYPQLDWILCAKLCDCLECKPCYKNYSSSSFGRSS